jgi:hypothetical protein
MKDGWILTIKIRLYSRPQLTTMTILEWTAKAYSYATFSVLSWKIEPEDKTRRGI